MQVLNTGTTYKIFDESMRAFDKIPAGVYKINFNPMAGYSLIKTDPIIISEKIYGNHLEKVDKVYRSFEIFPRNLGVILSGDKGIGKSLFAKLLSIKAVENGYPIIICDCHYPGIADFLGSIQQEIVILFDEFEKTFRSDKEHDVQAEMLTLFDGLYMGKKLFIITCNELRQLNDYLVNRPGRFHYHFRFGYPTEQEVNEYMRDNVNEEFWNEIPAVVNFSKKVDLNFDCLRAIAFELNTGVSFSEAANDLNIVNVAAQEYSLILYFKDGTVFRKKHCALDLFVSSEEFLWFSNSKDPNVRISFDPSQNIYDYEKGGVIIHGSNVDINYWENDDYDMPGEQVQKNKQRSEELDKVGIDFLLIKRDYDTKNIHYLV